MHARSPHSAGSAAGRCCCPGSQREPVAARASDSPTAPGSSTGSAGSASTRSATPIAISSRLPRSRPPATRCSRDTCCPVRSTDAISRALLRHAGKRLRHVWLSISGAIANENALKMLLQKQHPADRILAFEGNFAGRTTTLAEQTDKAAYREGLPLRGNVLLVPFFDAAHPDPIGRSLAALDAHLRRHPAQIAAMCFELVQGEGGIRTAPREFFAALMQRCRAAGIAVWVDEVQTFARTGELFAFRTLGLEEWVDVVTRRQGVAGQRRALHAGAESAARTHLGHLRGRDHRHGGGRAHHRAPARARAISAPKAGIALLGRRVERRFDALARPLPGRGLRPPGNRRDARLRRLRRPRGRRWRRAPRRLGRGPARVHARARTRRGSACCCPSTPPTKNSRPASRCSRRRCAASAEARRNCRADPATRRRARSRRPRRARRPARLDEPAERSRLPRAAHPRLAALLRAATPARRSEAVYVFVLEDLAPRRCVGTSTILAKHGTPESPHYWLELSTEERQQPELAAALRARQAAPALVEGRPHRDRRPDPRPAPTGATPRSAARRSRSCASRTWRRTPNASSAR